MLLKGMRCIPLGINVNQYVKLCAFADEASPATEEQIKALVDNAIPYLEIRGVNGVNISALDTASARDYARELKARGLSVWSIGSPAGKSQITDDFAKERDQFARLLEMADIFEAPCIRLFSFYGTDGSDAYFDEICRRVDDFCAMAKPQGVRPCHENEKGIYGDTVARCLKLHKALPDLSAVFDPANFIQCGQDIMTAWETLSPYVWYGHIKDALENGRIVPPGEGVGALRTYLPLFAAMARDGQNSGVLTLEPHLMEFVGLAALENETDKSDVGGYAYPNARAAFDHAAECLKGILRDI